MSNNPRILTHSRRHVNPLDLQRADVDITDIAHHLAQVNRFAGALDFPISVAIHSVYVSHLVERRLLMDAGILHHPVNGSGLRDVYRVAMQGLLHDASEAYLGDVTKWLKATSAMEGYREAEERAQSIIFLAFKLPIQQAAIVEWADRVMVRWEGLIGFGPAWSIVGPDGISQHPMYPPLTPEEVSMIDAIAGIEALNTQWTVARSAFVRRFNELNVRIERSNQ